MWNSAMYKSILEAQELVVNKDYSTLAIGHDWESIHECLDSDMPFNMSFDEYIFEVSEVHLNSDSFQIDMLRWLNRCLEICLAKY